MEIVILSMYGVIDIGSTRSKFFIYTREGEQVYSERVTIPVREDGTHDGEAIYRVVKHFITKARERGVKLIGLSTYRASVLAWRRDGTPVTPVLTWLYRPKLRYKFLPKLPSLGVVFSPVSPLLKIIELYKMTQSCRDCLIWTLESYLIYRLTGKFVSDATNATMTGIIHPKNFKLISLVETISKIDIELPEIVENVWEYGDINGVSLRVVIADQQAAAVGEGAVRAGVAKATFGTGLFVDVPTEEYKRVGGLIPLVILKYKQTVYRGVEGYLPAAGLAFEKLREWGIFEDFNKLDEYVDFADVDLFVLPALAGLQIPPFYWARGAIIGLTPYTDRREIISAHIVALVSFVKYVLDRSGEKVYEVKINGGLSKFDKLVQCLSEIVGINVTRNRDFEGTARGVALLLSVYEGSGKIGDVYGVEEEFQPLNRYNCAKLFSRWLEKMRRLKSLKRLFQEG